MRQQVEIRFTATTVEMLHHHRRVASYVRCYSRQRYITDDAHRPAAHRTHQEWPPSRMVAWGTSVGPAVGLLIDRILERHVHPEQSYRQCMGLISLGCRYQRDRLQRACARAVAINAISYTSVKSILAQNLDRLPIPSGEQQPLPMPLDHDNLRSARYFADDSAPAGAVTTEATPC